LFDYFIKFFIVAISGGIAIRVYKVEVFTDEWEAYWAVMIIICLFGFSVISLTYLTSFVFDNIGNA